MLHSTVLLNSPGLTAPLNRDEKSGCSPLLIDLSPTAFSEKNKATFRYRDATSYGQLLEDANGKYKVVRSPSCQTVTGRYRGGRQRWMWDR